MANQCSARKKTQRIQNDETNQSYERKKSLDIEEHIAYTISLLKSSSYSIEKVKIEDDAIKTK